MACAYLKRQGWQIVARNYRAVEGELDIVGKDQENLVFVEVKARTSNRFGGAAWAVPPAKQRQVARVAGHYLAANRLAGRVACRFDVVLVDAGQRPFGLTHIPNAFQMEVA